MAEFGIEAVVGVDPATGDRSVVSNQFTGAGSNFGGPVAVVELPDGDLAVSDFTLPDGARRLVLRGAPNQGPSP